MKKVLIAIGIIVLIILIFFISLPFWVDINEIVASQIPAIERRINRKVEIGDVRLTVLTGVGAEIDRIRVSNHPQDGKEDFVSARRIAVGIRLLPLLTGKVSIANVSLVEPAILVQRDAQGRFNFDDMLPASASPTSQSPAQPSETAEDAQKPEQLPLNIEISKVELQDGRIHFMDSLPQTPVDILLNNLQVKLGSISLLQPIKMNIQAELPSSSRNGQFTLSGHIGPVGIEPRPEMIPIDSVLTLTDIELPPLAPYLSGLSLRSGALGGRISARGKIAKMLKIHQSLDWKDLNLKIETGDRKNSTAVPVKVNGHWDIQTNISGMPPELTITSKANLDQSALEYGNLLAKPDTVPFNMDLQAEMMEAAYRINHINLNIGDMRSEASGSLKTGTETFDLDLGFKTNPFSAIALTDLSPEVKQALPADLILPDKMELAMEVSAVSPEVFDYSASVDLTQSTFKYGNIFNKSGSHPLTLASSGQLLKNALKIDDLKLRLGKLNLTASAQIKNFARPLIQAKAAIPSGNMADIAQVLPPLAPYQMKGTLDMSADCNGTLRQLSGLKGIQARLQLQKADFILPQSRQQRGRLDTSLAIANGVINLSETALTMGESALNIAARIKNIQKPQISLTMTSPFLDIDALLPAAGSEGQTAPTQDRPGKVQSTPPSKQASGTDPAAVAPDISAAGTVQIAKGLYKGTEFKNLYLDFNYDQALALINSLKTDIFSGSLQGSGKLNIKDMNHPSWDLNLQSSNIDTNSMLRSIAGVKDIISGRFNGNLVLAGQGREWSGISRTLSGSGQADIKNGVLTTVSLLDNLAESLFKTPAAGALAQALFPERTRSGEQTPFKDISAKFDIADAKIVTRNLQVDASDFILNASGFIGLNQSLDLSAKADLSDAVTASLARHKIYAYLLDKDGHLELPFALKGTLRKPEVHVEGGVIENLIKTSGRKALEEEVGKKLEKAAEKLKIKLPDLFK